MFIANLMNEKKEKNSIMIESDNSKKSGKFIKYSDVKKKDFKNWIIVIIICTLILIFKLYWCYVSNNFLKIILQFYLLNIISTIYHIWLKNIY